MNPKVILLILFPLFAYSQAQQKINFQSILRNTNGEIVANKSVSLKISILSGSISGSSVYSETHNKTTDASGLISLQIGNGTVLSGVFGNINWGNTSHFIKLEADFNGGSNYVVLGTQELMSVPYALYASKTDTSVLNLANRLATKLNGTDTASLSNRIAAKSSLSDTSLLNLTSRLATKLNSTDTAALSARINAISSLSDTSLLNLTSRFSTKLNGVDTAYLSNRIDAKLTKTDTASLSERIDTKLTKTDTSLLNLTSRLATKLNVMDTSFLSERIDTKLNKTDTSLLNLTSRLATKLNVTDTTFLSNRIDAKLSKTDTSLLNLTSRFSTKLNATGNVGIGQSAPDQLLHLKDATNGFVGIRLEGSNGSVPSSNYSGADFSIFASSDPQATANDFLGFQNNSTTDGATTGYKMVITKQGNVGIGTTTPNYKLHVEGSGTADEIVGWFNNQGAFSSSIAVRNSNKTAYLTNHQGLSTPNYTGQLASALALGVGAGVSPIQFWNGSPSSAKMTILENGNVLIGTTTTAVNEKLRVSGDVGSNSPSVAFTSANSNVSVPSGTPTTIYTFPTQARIVFYEVFVRLDTGGSPAQYAGMTTLAVGGGAIKQMSVVNGVLLVLTVSGLDLQVLQSSGATQNIMTSVRQTFASSGF